MNKSQKSRKEKRKVTAADLEAMQQVNIDAAGLDVGDDEIYVCVPKGRDEDQVRVFGTFTRDLYALADWLESCQITTVALESTGVLWLPVFQRLEEQGFEVILINAYALKGFARKTDVLDCQWLQQLHTYGLLRPSFQPERLTRQLRTIVRHRHKLLVYRGKHIQHMHKALQQMNLKLHNVLADITSKTGLEIIRAVIDGEHDPVTLAQFRDVRCKHSTEEIALALQGDYRAEHLFTLSHAVALFDFYTEKIQECDREIESLFAAFTFQVDRERQPLPPRRGRRKSSRAKNDLIFDARPHLYQISGIDLTAVDGFDESTILTILAETGVDMSPWPTPKHFASWLCLSPHQEVSGGKVLRSRSRKTSSQANRAFRLAARSLKKSDSALGVYYRRMKAKLGPAAAVTATAHKLARIFYHMLKNQTEFNYHSSAEEEEGYRQRMLRNLQRKARKLGATVITDS